MDDAGNDSGFVKRKSFRFQTQNHPQLQNLLRKDPSSYFEEYRSQYDHFLSLFSLYQLQPTFSSSTSSLDEFMTLVSFLSHTSYCYPNDSSYKEFPSHLMSFCYSNGSICPPELRKCLITNLIILKNKGQIDSLTKLYQLCFDFWKIRDKNLRSQIYSFLKNDIKLMNSPTKNEKLNKTLQNFLVQLWSRSSSSPETNESFEKGSKLNTQKKENEYHSNNSSNSNNYDENLDEIYSHQTMERLSLRLMIELYYKGIWNDARTVNYISMACLSNNIKLTVPALYFFIGKRRKINPQEGSSSSNTFSEDDDDNERDHEDMYGSEDEASSVPDIAKLKHSLRVSGKNKSKSRKLKKALATLKNADKLTADSFNELDDNQDKIHRKHQQRDFSSKCIALLNDPEGFAEKLFYKLKTSRESYVIRLLMMNVISRLIGYYKLILLPFYSYICQYLKPNQKECTKILVYTAQSIHALIPKEELTPIIQTILRYFVAEYCTPEVITVGLNGLREICARHPDAMDPTTIGYIVAFKDYKNKSVMMAARSIITLFRNMAPHLLPKKELGKEISFKLRNQEREKRKMISVEKGLTDSLNPTKDVPSNVLDKENSLSLTEESKDEMELENDECDLEIDDNYQEDETLEMDSSEENDSSRSDIDEDAWELDKNTDDEEANDDATNASIGDDDDGCESLENEEIDYDEKPNSVLRIKADKLATGESLMHLMTKQILTEDELLRLKNEKYQTDSNDSFNTANEEPSEFIRTSQIKGYVKTRSTYEDRLANIKAGRDPKDKYKFKHKKVQSNASQSNVEKRKTKNFLMMRHKRGGLLTKFKNAQANNHPKKKKNQKK